MRDASDNAGKRRAPAVDVRSLTTVGILVAIIMGFYVAVYLYTRAYEPAGNPHFFLTPANLSNLLGQAAIVGILACGMTLVIVAGHIDLSVGSLLGMLGGVAAWLLRGTPATAEMAAAPGWSSAAAMAAAVALGAALGALHGSLVAGLHVPAALRRLPGGGLLQRLEGVRIPAFVVTLGGFMAYRGVLQIIARRTIPVAEESAVVVLGAGVLPMAWAWVLAALLVAGVVAGVVLRRRGDRAVGLESVALGWDAARIAAAGLVVFGLCYWLNRGDGVPLRFVVMLLIAVVVSVVASRFTFGRRVYAIGGNVEAATYSGIRVGWHLIGVFAIMGGIAAIAGLVSVGRLGAATAAEGDLMELYAIAACVIGGTSLSGGRGTVFGAIVGALIMATIRNGLSALGRDSSIEKIVLGVILVLAVGFDLLLSRRKS